jgi:hypothetical protein
MFPAVLGELLIRADVRDHDRAPAGGARVTARTRVRHRRSASGALATPVPGRPTPADL